MANDIDKLQGTWYVTSLEMDGADNAAALAGEATIAIKSSRFESQGMGATYKGTVKLGKEKGLGSIDLVFTAGPEKGNVNRGIYKLSGEKWTLCLNTTDGPRPKKFATTKGSGVVLEVLGRKPATAQASGVAKGTAKGAAKKPSAAGAAADSVTPSGPPTAIEGEWQMESAIFNGAPMDAAMVAWVKRTSRGDVTKVVAGGQTMLHARFTLDAARGSNAIDYTDNYSGANKGKSQQGIYELKGKSLRICMAAPGKPRPTAFGSKKGDGQSFTTFSRVGP